MCRAAAVLRMRLYVPEYRAAWGIRAGAEKPRRRKSTLRALKINRARTRVKIVA